jgi:hypothetical protein
MLACCCFSSFYCAGLYALSTTCSVTVVTSWCNCARRLIRRGPSRNCVERTLSLRGLSSVRLDIRRLPLLRVHVDAQLSKNPDFTQNASDSTASVAETSRSRSLP